MPRTPTSQAPTPAPAFDSHPSDLVLVKSFLRPWVARGVVRAGAFVHAADIYAADPAELARRHRAAVARDGGRAWYFLSPLRAKSPRGRRKARTVAGGAGWWHGEAGPKPVLDPLDGRRKVGYRQSFSFMRRAGGAPVRTGWIMVELRLHDDNDGAAAGGDQPEGLVLCKVYRSPRHHAAPDGGDGEEEESCAVTAIAAARAAPHGNADDADGSSDAALAAAAAVALGGKRKADEEEGSSAATTATPRRQNADGDETSGAAAATVPGLREEPAGHENEISGATTATELGCKEEKAVEDVDSSASTPAPARKRAKTAEDEGAGAAPAGERKAAGAPVNQLQCPQCGFHLGALQLQALMAPTKSTSETETETVIAPTQADAPQGAGTADASVKELSFHRLF